ncbi:MAG: hypothetical protein GY765_12075 [bacterium]|nr:hypothetical protein [bacterium]
MTKILKKSFYVCIVIAVLLVNTACEERHTTSEISADGACTRIVEIKSDSPRIFNDAFPVPADSTWKVTKKVVAKDDKKKEHVYRAVKSFQSVAALNGEYAQMRAKKPGGRIHFELEKKYVWFFTHYTYRETYLEFFPFRKIPMADFFSEQEQQIIAESLLDEEKAAKKYSPSRLKELEKRFLEWAGRSIFEELFQIMLDTARRSGRSQLTEVLKNKKEELYDVAFTDYKMEILKLDEIPGKLGAILPSDELQGLMEKYKAEYSVFEEKFRMVDNIFGDEFSNKVIMPGLITETNAAGVSGSSVSWEFGPDEFFLSDYSMWVTSRKLNWWAVAIGGFVLILLLIIPLAAARIRRKRLL